eukprot:1421506-Rhodomonas_salina.3
MLGSFDQSLHGAVHSGSNMISVLAGDNEREYPLAQVRSALLLLVLSLPVSSPSLRVCSRRCAARGAERAGRGGRAR